MNGSPQTPLRRALLLIGALMVVTALLSVLAIPAFAQEGTSTQPSSLNPAGPNSAAIASLFTVVLVIATAVFVVVEGLILISAFRFRHRVKDTSEPTQVHGNTKAEIAWTILPALIVVTLFVMALQTQQTLDTKPVAAAPEQITVKVIGHQFWWEYQYSDLGITTATDLVIPTDTVVNLELTSADVIHSFWVPQLNGKTDAFPNHVNTTWIQANTPGIYYGQCAELCGASHANMRVVVVAKTPDEFDQWVKQQQAAPVEPTDALAQQGQQTFMTGACIGCHTINGTAANGKVGPNLTHLASRTSLAGGSLTESDGNLRRWLANPPALKPGSMMPNLNLTTTEIDALVAYLQSLK
ncbi:MAG TPA: cytochrome c oxidase subunit II [Anaerolineae bacterium]|nr:cytochrome c oxidase subunit II [Anaerolineae bacterium]